MHRARGVTHVRPLCGHLNAAASRHTRCAQPALFFLGRLDVSLARASGQIDATLQVQCVCFCFGRDKVYLQRSAKRAGVGLVWYLRNADSFACKQRRQLASSLRVRLVLVGDRHGRAPGARVVRCLPCLLSAQSVLKGLDQLAACVVTEYLHRAHYRMDMDHFLCTLVRREPPTDREVRCAVTTSSRSAPFPLCPSARNIALTAFLTRASVAAAADRRLRCGQVVLALEVRGALLHLPKHHDALHHMVPDIGIWKQGNLCHLSSCSSHVCRMTPTQRATSAPLASTLCDLP